MNIAILKGNLTRDNELRYLTSGSAVCTNSIATSKKWKDQNGQVQEKTMFMEVVIFGKGAEIFNQYTKKGSKVLLNGSIELDQWQDQNGQNRSKHKLNVNEFEFLDSKPQDQNHGNNYNQTANYNQPQQQYQQPLPQVEYDGQEIPF